MPSRRPVREAHPDILEQPPPTRHSASPGMSLHPIQLAAIMGTLDHFHVVFDVWFSERALTSTVALSSRPSSGCANRVTSSTVRARSGWCTTDFGDDKDRVLIRANDVPTLFRRRRRVLPEQEGPRLRREDSPPGRRPPRLHQPTQGHRGLRRRRPEHNIEVKIGQLVNIAGERMGKRLGNALYMDDPHRVDRIGCGALLARALPRRLPAVAGR